jgi:uncharacterized lipoprotein YajG
MSKPLLTILAGLLLLAGCAQHYVIVQNDFTQISASTKPKLKDGYYYYKDAQGKDASISSGRVREVAPASMVTDPTAGFKTAR